VDLVRILLLAGGAGTRLWPLSTDERPKQFLPLLSERSLLAETYDRLAPLGKDVFVATSARHAGLVREELPEVPADRVLAEPARRNSGPAILAAALRVAADGDPVTAAVPSDQTVKDPAALRSALEAAARAADRAAVVVLGVAPTRPETDFGYMETRDDGEGGLEVVRFVEKPPLERARALAASGWHFWNAGMFVFRPTRFLAEARRVAGPLTAGVERFVASGAAADYEALPSISIDYAVMEKASGVRAERLDAAWSDVGTWRSVRDLRGASDANGNLLLAPGPVLAPGLRETAVVVGPEGVLVLPFEREGELRAAVDALRSKKGAGAAVGAARGRR
jgi:mannose-1-phosphate guanylyltransferase